MANNRINAFSLRDDITVVSRDENNNEILRTERELSLKKVLAFLGTLAVVGCVATIALAGTGSIGGSVMAEVQSPVNGMTHLLKARKLLSKSNHLEQEKIEKLKLIRELKGEKDTGKPEEIRADLCYTSACLDTAIDLLKAINFTVNPCDNFYEFACGRWLAENPLPASQSRWSRFNRLRDNVNTITQQILNSAKDDADARPINQVKDYFKDCVNTAALEALGLDPVKTILTELGGWPLLNSAWNGASFDPIAAIGNIRRKYLSQAIIGVSVSQDLKETSRNVVYLDQPNFFISRSMLVDPDRYATQIAAYKTYLNAVATRFGTNLTPAALTAAINSVVTFESQLATASSTDEARYDMERIYNPKILSAYQAEIDPSLATVNLDVLLAAVFSSSGVSVPQTERVIVFELEYMTSLVNILAATDKATIANYLLWRVASSLISDTTQEMRDITFEFQRVLTGATAPQPRNVTCANAANNGFGMAIGVKYIAAAFDLEAKSEVDGLVENLRTSFREMLTTSDWMLNPTTKEAADLKAQKMKSFMAFPEWLEDKDRVEEEFAGLEITPGSYLASDLLLANWAGDKELKKLRQPTSKDEWLTYPGVVNAFYSPEHNSITFPAGILQPPFFGKGRPMSQNYGGIGVVIGHEITHGFDNQGSQFDGDGNVADWWDATTRAEYERKTTCVKDQYSAFVTPVGPVNGELTLGENIADNGGLREALFAYRHYLTENPEGALPGLENFSHEQLFFLGYANIWCENITPAGLEAQLLSDPHSPAEFRVKGPLRNSVEFTAAYDCAVGDYMRPPDSERCVVW